MNLYLLLSGIVFSLLVIGSLSDLKTRRVSNYITGAVIIVSLPMILNNTGNLSLLSFVFPLAMFLSMGAADGKALFPISLSIPTSILWIYIAIFCVVGLYYIVILKKKDDVPAFVPITVAYLVVAVMLFA